MSRYPPEPTGAACNNHLVSDWDGTPTLALWYPQMGGYSGKAVVVGNQDGGCFNVYVWHDGEFPFSEEDKNPYKLHHCRAKQFRDFADAVEAFNGKDEGP